MFGDTTKIYDFSPEQLQNLLAIVWLYRGQGDRFLGQAFDEAHACFETEKEDGGAIHPLANFETALADLQKTLQPFLDTLPNPSCPGDTQAHEKGEEHFRTNDAAHSEVLQQLEEGRKTFEQDVDAFGAATEAEAAQWEKQARDSAALNKAIERLVKLVERLAPLAETSRDLVKQADLLYKLACRLIDVCEGELTARESGLWVSREITRARKAADEARQVAVDQLKQVRYFHRQATWLTERFPDGVLRDVEGLVKLADKAELEANDWSLTPGRYVGVAPEEEDENFDFEEALRDIHVELNDLNAEAVELAAKIQRNFEEMGG